MPVSPVFDDFRLVRKLGEGGMGTVWLAQDTCLDRPVALKFLSSTEEGTQGRTRLLAEARALARMHHPNVAAVYRIGEVEGQPYIAYEYIDGVSLAQMMRPLPWRSVLEIGLGLARGLAAVHRQGVLHCDIKPANVVLTRGGEPKLIDFGIARVRGAHVGLVGAPPSDGAFAGTPFYMAPELWQGQAFSEQTDIYALGLVLHELLAGRRVQPALAADEMIAYLATREVDHLGGLVAGVPAALADLVARLTAVGPGDRPRRADAVVDGLEIIRSLYRNFTERQSEAEDDQARLLAHLQGLLDQGAEIGRHFYEALFTRHPDVRPLFPAEMAAQRRKLEGAIELVVRGLGDQEMLVPLLEDLGRRHAGYGVVPEHFEAVGHQLLATLETLSGPTWNDELRRAWAHAYDRIAHVMVRGLNGGATENSATQEFVPPTQWDLPIGPPVTHYARSGQVSIAYQVIGAGPLDLLVVPDSVSQIELCWQQPRFATFLRRLSSFTRLILIERRGTGLSDRAPGALALDEQVLDLDAVLDAVGIDRAALLCLGTGAELGAAYAVMRPERTRALVLQGAALGRPGGEPLLERHAPSLAEDPECCAWWARYRQASGAEAAPKLGLELGPLLPVIGAPTLVLHRQHDRCAPIEGARTIAAQIQGALLRELEGRDHLPFVGDAEAIVAEVHRFLAALPAAEPARSRLVSTLALAVHEPACAPTVRALFTRALASVGAPVIDGETMTAELSGAGLISLSARTLLATCTLLGLPVSAAVITELQDRGETLTHRARAHLLAQTTAPGQLGLNALARALSQGGRAVIGEDGAERR